MLQLPERSKFKRVVHEAVSPHHPCELNSDISNPIGTPHASRQCDDDLITRSTLT